MECAKKKIQAERAISGADAEISRQELPRAAMKGKGQRPEASKKPGVSQPSFVNQMAAYRPNTLLTQSRQSLLRIDLPAELQSGLYTFYALAIRTGADVKDQIQWISLGSATVMLR